MTKDEEVKCFKEYKQWYLDQNITGAIAISLDESFQAGWEACLRSHHAAATSEAEPAEVPESEWGIGDFIDSDRCERLGE